MKYSTLTLVNAINIIISKHLKRRNRKKVFTVKCKQCNKSETEFISGLPGEYKNVDTDYTHNGKGLAVCPSCIGTSRILISGDILIPWEKMSEQVLLIRASNFRIQFINTNHLENNRLVNENNEKLKILMRKAMELVNYKVPENCLARIILDKDK